MAFRTRRHVDWGDCDAAGIVFYPNFFRWMDSVFHELSTEKGFDHTDLDQYGVFATPLRDVGAAFRTPARYNTWLTVEALVTRVGETGFGIGYRFLAGDRLVAEGREDRVCVKQVLGGISKTPIPDPIRAALESLR